MSFYMKLKKFLLILLATVSCACIGLACGCITDDEPGGGPGDTEKDECTVNFELSEHVSYVIDGKEVPEYQMKVDKDSSVKFSVVVEDGFLADTVEVKANGVKLSATDGVYSHFVSEDATVNATVLEDLLEVDANDGYFVVSSLKDLKSVASLVNSGNVNYVTGKYKLANDIDCGGAQLDVIGYNDQHAFFSGIFDGQGHTISNYKITTVDQTYVGLFGCVQVSTETTDVIIQNLNLKDFVISATAAPNGNVIAGGIAAIIAGANVVACSAEGAINVYGSGYFSYAGGAVAIQQSITTSENNTLFHYHSSTEYVHTNVRISASNGYILAAGGVVGYAVSSHERATSMILNCYAEGDVYGAMSSGGVVGRLGDYSSIANCYSTGLIDTTVSFENTGSEVDDKDYFAYAGGIAAYVGVETTISDCFTTCILNATGINTKHAMGDIYAYASPATEFVNAVTVFNSYADCESEIYDDTEIKSYATPGEVSPKDASFIKGTLKWNDADWVIKDGAYPTTNLTEGNVSFKVTLNFVGETVNKGEKTKDYSVSIMENSYFSFSSHAGQYFDEIIVADAAGHTSYGFFFDEACTQRVHYSYVPTRNVTIYVGFADYSEVAGTYEFEQATGRTIKLTLNDDGTFTYLDVRLSSGTYAYDGDKLIFNDALFARLKGNAVKGENNSTMPWLNYEPYRFVGALSGDELLVYDGTYFTNEVINGKDNRLAFTKAGTEQTDKNGFIGTWERSATLNEKYVFGTDTWSYSWKNNEQSGKYSVSEGVATLTDTSGNTVIATASIDNSGLLLVKKSGESDKYFCIENSFLGNWYSSEHNAYLVLDGCGNGLAGSATAIIDGVYFEELSYVKDGFFDAFAPDGGYTYTLLSSYSLFGYFTYDATTNTIKASLYDASIGGFQKFDFVLYDYYLGEWITQDEVGGETPFTIMDFNGLGLYKAEGDATLGYIVINETKVPYECSVENGLNGTFTYEGTAYVLTTNGDGTVTITTENGSVSAEFTRKDEMAKTPLVAAEDNVYRFNGGGKLSNGGILTITYSQKSDKWGTVDEYGYKIVSGSIDGSNIVIELYNLVNGKIVGESLGTISIVHPKFVLQFNGQKAINLDLYFGFTGSWSISGLMNNFRIGKFDLTYEARGTYNRHNDVPFKYFPEYNYILVSFRVDGEDSFESYYLINYLLLIDDNNLIVSSYPYLASGDQTYYATHSDEVVGTWENTKTGASLEFDGCADSKYRVGIAFDSTNSITYLYTRRFGTLYMWLEEGENVVAAYTVYYDEYDDEFLGDIVYRKPNTRYGSLKLTEVSDLLGEPILTATDNGTNYEFYFDGTVKVGDKSGKGSINSVNGNVTTMDITLDDGTVMTVEVNHDGTVTVID